MANSPSDRMQLIGRGELLPPGHCMHCQNGNCDEGYVTLNTFYDYEGEQYLCRNCVTMVIETVNGLELEEALVLRDQANFVQAANKNLIGQLEVANARLHAYDAVFNGLDLGSIVRDAVSGVAVITSLEDAPEGNDEPSGSADAGEPEPAEPVTKPGPDDVKRSPGRDITSGERKLKL